MLREREFNNGFQLDTPPKPHRTRTMLERNRPTSRRALFRVVGSVIGGATVGFHDATASAPQLRLRHAVDQLGGRAAWLDLPPLVSRLLIQGPLLSQLRLPGAASMAFSVHFEQDEARVDGTATPPWTWGYDGVDAWTATNGRRTDENIADARFWVPALKWYAAMPHKLLDPSIQTQADPLASNALNITFPGVPLGDEMTAWLDEQGRFVRLDHTARALGPDVRVRAEWRTWQSVRDVSLPSQIHLRIQMPAMPAVPVQIQFLDWTIREPAPDFFEKPSTEDFRSR